MHEGVQDGIDAVFPEMLAEVQRLQALHPDFTVLVNGHSLGGALATMSAIRLQIAGVDVKLITVGGYRIGDPDFVDFFNQRIPDAYRVVNNKDLAVHGPMRFLGYKHVGTEMYQEQGSVVTRQCDGSGQDHSCSYQWEWKFWTWSFADHLIYFGEDIYEFDLSIMCDYDEILEWN